MIKNLIKTYIDNQPIKVVCLIIDYKKFSSFSDWENSRDCSNDIPARYGKAQKKPYIKGSEKDLETNFTKMILY